jgi:ribosome-binding protein aMBF1 (putative translation factor)
MNSFPWKIDVLTRTANAIEGLPLSKDERLEQAKHLVRVLNYTEVAAAKALAISKTTVSYALQADEVAERLAKHRFTDKISLSTLGKLYRIKQDGALVEVAKLVKEAQLSGEEATEVAKKVEAAAASEKQQHNILEELRRDYRDRIARTKRGELKRQIAPTIKLRHAVNAINAIRSESVTPLEPDLARRAKWAIKKLEEVTKSAVRG